MPVKKVPLADRVDIWMPYYISDSYFNTRHLSDFEFRCYMDIRSHLWRYGAISSEAMENLCRVSRDASSIPLASLKHMMEHDEVADTWHFEDLRLLREEWINKKIKASEKAANAANARHSRNQKAKTGDASSIPQASKNTRQRDAPGMLTGSPSSLTGKTNTTPSLRSGVGAAAGRDPGGSDGFAVSSLNGKNYPGGRIRPVDESQTSQVGKGASEAKQSRLPPSTTGAKASGVAGKTGKNADARFEPFRQRLKEWWEYINKESAGSSPWGMDAGRALKGMLEAEPRMTIETLEHRLVNRAQAVAICASHPRPKKGDVMPRELLSIVIKQLPRYEDGPVDGFGVKLN